MWRQIIGRSIAGRHPFFPRSIFLEAFSEAALVVINDELRVILTRCQRFS